MVEQREPLGPHLLGHLVGPIDGLGRHRGAERIRGEVHPGRGIEEAARVGVVVDRRAHGVQGAIADVEALAVVDGAHPRVRDPEGGAGAASCRPGHHHRGVRATLERFDEVAGVIVVVVGEVDPPDFVVL